MKYLAFGKESITLFFIMGIMVLVSSGVVAYLNSKDQLDSNDYIMEGYKRINTIEKIQSKINESESSRRGYQLTSDDQYVTSIDLSKLEVDTLLKSLRLSVRDNPRQQTRADTLYILVNERFALFKASIEIQNTKGSNSKLINPIRDRGKIVNSDINSIAARIKSEELTSINVKHELGDKSYWFTFFTILGGIIVSSIIFISIFIILKKNIKFKSPEDEEITREELENIVRDRTAEMSQLNNKLNTKISELEKKDVDLKKSELYYRTLFEQAHDAIMIIDPENEVVLDVNNRACEIYGLKRDEFIGLSLKSISKNVKMGDENLKMTLEKGTFHHFQTVHYNKNLNEMLMEINASIVNYHGKKAILSINRDITDRVLMIH